MTLEEYQKSLASLTQDVLNQTREMAYVSAANKLLATIKNRIQRQGVDSNGAKMKAYSTKPYYAQRSSFVKRGSFKAEGKRGFKGERVVKATGIRINKKTGKVKKLETKYFIAKTEVKTMFLKDGYKQFREIQGRQTGHRDLTLSGQTMLNYVMGVTEGKVLLGFDTDRSSKIRKGHEKRNGGNIYYASQDELNQFNEDVAKNEEKLILRVFNINK